MQTNRQQTDRPPLPGTGRMEDYTGPFLVATGCLTFMALVTLWAVWGLLAAVLAGYAADRMILRIARR